MCVSFPSESPVSGVTRGSTYPHSSMQRPGDLVILLKPRAASKNFREPELAHSSLHVLDLSVGGLGSLDPLRGLATNTAHHVGVGESLGGALAGLRIELGGQRLGDPRVQRRGPAGDEQAVLALGSRRTVGVAGARTKAQRGRHGASGV